MQRSPRPFDPDRAKLSGQLPSAAIHVTWDLIQGEHIKFYIVVILWPLEQWPSQVVLHLL